MEALSSMVVVYTVVMLQNALFDTKNTSGFRIHSTLRRLGCCSQSAWPLVLTWVSWPDGSVMAPSSVPLRRCNRYTTQCMKCRVMGPLQGSLQHQTMCLRLGLQYFCVELWSLSRVSMLGDRPQWRGHYGFNVITTALWEEWSVHKVCACIWVPENCQGALRPNADPYGDHSSIQSLLEKRRKCEIIFKIAVNPFV